MDDNRTERINAIVESVSDALHGEDALFINDVLLHVAEEIAQRAYEINLGNQGRHADTSWKTCPELTVKAIATLTSNQAERFAETWEQHNPS